MFKKLFILLFSIIIFTGCIQKDNKDNLYQTIIKNDKIIVGISLDAKPFGFKDSKGEIQGMEADLAREIAQRILGDSSKVVFKDINPQDRIKTVTAGNVDILLATMTITPERKKLVYFSKPYFIAGQVICVKKDSKIDSLDDLLNKRIIVILGTTGEKNIKRFAPNALIQGYVNNSDAINAFKSGSDDAITTDDSLLQGLVMEENGYIILPKKLTKEPYGIAFKKSNGTSSFKKELNKVIQDIKEDGTLKRIKDKWNLK